jgi:hypothetical protein
MSIQKNKEAILQEISDIGQSDTSDMAHRSGGLTVEQALDGLAETSMDIEQEPVMEVQSFGEKQIFFLLKPLSDGDKLYTAPPKREWVGLTEDEITKIANKTLTFKQCVQAIEAKLRDKNQ